MIHLLVQTIVTRDVTGQEAINGSESVVVVLKKERSECDVCTFSSSLRFVLFCISEQREKDLTLNSTSREIDSAYY